MIDPDDAFDLLTDQVALAEWAEAHGMPLRQAIRHLTPLAENASSDSKILRAARATHQRRGREVARRTDVEDLVAFVERAGRLPGRLRQVFALCYVEGLSRRECAARLGIKPETVRVHLRRLRNAMHEAETRRVVERGITPGFGGYPTGG